MTHVDAGVDKEVLSRCIKFLKDAVNTNLQQPIEHLDSFGKFNHLIKPIWPLKLLYFPDVKTLTARIVK